MLQLRDLFAIIDNDTQVELVLWNTKEDKHYHTIIKDSAINIKNTINLDSYKFNTFFNYDEYVAIDVVLK